ncbi:hypothetical protein SAMN05421813_10396 [Daejeonella rubra]|uniref:Uncharacterized protein n=1 Tax=Daejeonella rubra TaxID=990371 RepID=A0A1G9NMH5_9SPHI|nr:hypothetical protein SAMN05421813_10396 [Daejeonella rubra]
MKSKSLPPENALYNLIYNPSSKKQYLIVIYGSIINLMRSQF